MKWLHVACYVLFSIASFGQTQQNVWPDCTSTDEAAIGAGFGVCPAQRYYCRSTLGATYRCKSSVWSIVSQETLSGIAPNTIGLTELKTINASHMIGECIVVSAITETMDSQVCEVNNIDPTGGGVVSGRLPLSNLIGGIDGECLVGNGVGLDPVYETCPGSGGIGTRVSADCAGETGGVQGEECYDTVEIVWYVCSTPTCTGANWEVQAANRMTLETGSPGVTRLLAYGEDGSIVTGVVDLADPLDVGTSILPKENVEQVYVRKDIGGDEWTNKLIQHHPGGGVSGAVYTIELDDLAVPATSDYGGLLLNSDDVTADADAYVVKFTRNGELMFELNGDGGVFAIDGYTSGDKSPGPPSVGDPDNIDPGNRIWVRDNNQGTDFDTDCDNVLVLPEPGWAIIDKNPLDGVDNVEPVLCTYDGTTRTEHSLTTSAGHVIQDETGAPTSCIDGAGKDCPAQPNLAFTGAGVTVEDVPGSNQTLVTINSDASGDFVQVIGDTMTGTLFMDADAGGTGIIRLGETGSTGVDRLILSEEAVSGSGADSGMIEWLTSTDQGGATDYQWRAWADNGSTDEFRFEVGADNTAMTFRMRNAPPVQPEVGPDTVDFRLDGQFFQNTGDNGAGDEVVDFTDVFIDTDTGPGLVPDTGATTSTRFLRDDGTWIVPPGGFDATSNIHTFGDGTAAFNRLFWDLSGVQDPLLAPSYWTPTTTGGSPTEDYAFAFLDGSNIQPKANLFVKTMIGSTAVNAGILMGTGTGEQNQGGRLMIAHYCNTIVGGCATEQPAWPIAAGTSTVGAHTSFYGGGSTSQTMTNLARFFVNSDLDERGTDATGAHEYMRVNEVGNRHHLRIHGQIQMIEDSDTPSFGIGDGPSIYVADRTDAGSESRMFADFDSDGVLDVGDGEFWLGPQEFTTTGSGTFPGLVPTDGTTAAGLEYLDDQGNFTVPAGSGGGGWQDDNPIIRLVTIGDEVVIGSATAETFDYAAGAGVVDAQLSLTGGVNDQSGLIIQSPTGGSAGAPSIYVIDNADDEAFGVYNNGHVELNNFCSLDGVKTTFANCNTITGHDFTMKDAGAFEVQSIRDVDNVWEIDVNGEARMFTVKSSQAAPEMIWDDTTETGDNRDFVIRIMEPAQNLIDVFFEMDVGGGGDETTRSAMIFDAASSGLFDVQFGDTSDANIDVNDFTIDMDAGGTFTIVDGDVVLPAGVIDNTEMLTTDDYTFSGDWVLETGQLEPPNGLTGPSAGDCNVAAHTGRIYIDTNEAQGERLFICDGSAWVLENVDSGGAIEVKEDDSTKEAFATIIDFGLGFDVLSSPAGEANITLDYTENAPTLGTETDGDYVEGIVAGNAIDVTASGGEGSTPTVLVEANSIDEAELGPTIALAATDFLDLSASDSSTLTEGLKLPQDGTACVTGFGEGQVCWLSTTTPQLMIGNGSGFEKIAVTGTLTDGQHCTWDDTNNEIDCDSGAGGGGTISVEEETVEKESDLGTLNFGSGFDVASSPAGTANVTLDYTENPPALGTETDGDYVEDLIAGNAIDITGTGGEGSTPTVLVEANSIDQAELAATITLGATDFLDLSAIDSSTTTEGLKLPQDGTACVTGFAEGQVCWEALANPALKIGNGTGFEKIAVTGTLTNGQLCTWDGAGNEIDCDSAPGGATIDIQEDDSSVVSAATAIDFGLGFDVADDGGVEGDITLNYTEDPPNLSNTETVGTLTIAKGGTNLTASNQDEMMIGNGTTWQAKVLPDCTGSTEVCQYNNSTNAWAMVDLGGHTSSTLAGDVSGTIGANVVDDVQTATANLEAANNDSSQVATTSFVQQEINNADGTDLTCASGVCNVNNPVTAATTSVSFTGSLVGDVSGTQGATVVDDVQTATANLEADDNNSTQVATTSFVQQEINDLGGTDLSCAGGTCNVNSPVAAATTSVSFTGSLVGDVSGTQGATVVDDVQVATTNQEAVNNDSGQVASTSFVQQEINGAGGTNLSCSSGQCNVATTGGDTSGGIDNIAVNDVQTATANTETTGNDTTQVATTQFVQQELDAVIHMESFVLETPADADNFLWFKAPFALTVTNIDCLVDAATSVAITVQECNADGGSCGTTDAFTCNTTNSDSGAITDSAIDSGDWMRLDIGTVTGTPGHVAVTLQYTVP